MSMGSREAWGYGSIRAVRGVFVAVPNTVFVSVLAVADSKSTYPFPCLNQFSSPVPCVHYGFCGGIPLPSLLNGSFARAIKYPACPVSRNEKNTGRSFAFPSVLSNRNFRCHCREMQLLYIREHLNISVVLWRRAQGVLFVPSFDDVCAHDPCVRAARSLRSGGSGCGTMLPTEELNESLANARRKIKDAIHHRRDARPDWQKNGVWLADMESIVPLPRRCEDVLEGHDATQLFPVSEPHGVSGRYTCVVLFWHNSTLYR